MTVWVPRVLRGVLLIVRVYPEYLSLAAACGMRVVKEREIDGAARSGLLYNDY